MTTTTTMKTDTDTIMDNLLPLTDDTATCYGRSF